MKHYKETKKFVCIIALEVAESSS